MNGFNCCHLLISVLLLSNNLFYLILIYDAPFGIQFMFVAILFFLIFFMSGCNMIVT
jgi:hypothetical protein